MKKLNDDGLAFAYQPIHHISVYKDKILSASIMLLFVVIYCCIIKKLSVIAVSFFFIYVLISYITYIPLYFTSIPKAIIFHILSYIPIFTLLFKFRYGFMIIIAIIYLIALNMYVSRITQKLYYFEEINSRYNKFIEYYVDFSECKLVDYMSKNELIQVCQEMELPTEDMTFFLDFKFHLIKRNTMCKKYGYSLSSLYPHYAAIHKKIQDYVTNM